MTHYSDSNIPHFSSDFTYFDFVGVGPNFGHLRRTSDKRWTRRLNLSRRKVDLQLILSLFPNEAMTSLSVASVNAPQVESRWKRDVVVTTVLQFEQKAAEVSQRQWSQQAAVPRSTLQYWLQRKASLDSSLAVIAFFESPEGLAFLHRFVLALHFVFTKVGVASAHNVSEFLSLSGLSPFVAASETVQKRLSRGMDEAMVQFAQEERSRLSSCMPAKTISVCEDETFHPEVCLVAMEPVSNFILVEKYAANRDAATWNGALREALSGLPVQVLQSSSDEGKGLLCHVQKGLQVHHSPDLFHVSYEITKGTAGALAAAVRAAEERHQKAAALAHKALQEKQTLLQHNQQPAEDYLSLFERRLAVSQTHQQQAEAALQQAQLQQAQVREAKVAIAQVYHPYDLETAAPQQPAQVASQLRACFEKLHQATAALSERCQKHLRKAQRLIDPMQATLAFFFSSLKLLVQDLGLPPALETLFLEKWVPGFYLQQAAAKEKQPQRRQCLQHKAQELLASLSQRAGPLEHLSLAEWQRLERAARQGAQLFQRSSSCVEGRNAQLSLRHHSLHRLSNSRLQALTAVHNYHLQRPDGTTAAERFFETKPRDLFEWLLDHTDLPARPRRSHHSSPTLSQAF